MATPSGDGRLSSRGHLAGDWGVLVDDRQRPNSEVIDLSTSHPEQASATATTTEFCGVALSDFSIGDRLGATRDGGKGFQVKRLVPWICLIPHLCLQRQKYVTAGSEDHIESDSAARLGLWERV